MYWYQHRSLVLTLLSFVVVYDEYASFYALLESQL